MTEAPAQQMPVVQPEANSRLEQLLASYDDAKSEYEAAEARFKGIKDSIKVELVAAAPGHTKVFVSCEYLSRPLQLSARTEWRVDVKLLKAEGPELYVQYAKQSVSWRLEARR